MSTFFDSKAGIWTGRILSALPGLLFLGSASAKLSGAAQVIEQFGKFGYPAGTLPAIGVVELVCAILYLVPRTAVLGAVLLTAYLGGATATHLRVGEPFMAPVLIGVLLWAGLFARDARVRGILPLRGAPFGA
jgi:multidrug efflux pump subunit AcrB